MKNENFKNYGFQRKNIFLKQNQKFNFKKIKKN